MLETQSHSTSSEFSGPCSQTCTIIPIKLESCSSDVTLESSVGVATVSAVEG